jgi:hypothetical protein
MSAVYAVVLFCPKIGSKILSWTSNNNLITNELNPKEILPPSNFCKGKLHYASLLQTVNH